MKKRLVSIIIAVMMFILIACNGGNLVSTGENTRDGLNNAGDRICSFSEKIGSPCP